jgi:hypothetical protein
VIGFLENLPIQQYREQQVNVRVGRRLARRIRAGEHDVLGFDLGGETLLNCRM